MSKRKLVIVLAVLVALVPFLGFPGSWENFFVALAGALIALLSADLRFLKRKKKPARRPKERQPGVTEVYVENAPTKQADDYKGELG